MSECRRCSPNATHDAEHPSHKNDRIALLPDKFHWLAYGFRYDASRSVLIPVTKKLRAFTAGDGDTHTYPWAPAGYSDAMGHGPNEQIGNIANCYRGGAWSDTYDTQLLSLVVGQPSLRIIDASVVAGSSETPTFPRGGGSLPTVRGDVPNASDLRLAMLADLWSAMMHGSQAKLMPPGVNTSCSAICGTLRTMNTGFTVGHRCLTEANTNSVHKCFSPNKIEFDFNGGLDSVPLRSGVTPPADGDFVVVDFSVSANIAYVHGEAMEGVDEIDRLKIAAWKLALANGATGFAPPSLPSDNTTTRLAQLAETFQRRLAAMERGELPSDTLREVNGLQRGLADILASAAKK